MKDGSKVRYKARAMIKILYSNISAFKLDKLSVLEVQKWST